ncbi:MAG: 23S rRNA (pseudouridine(1915)-N(3))-methyltransferase RlmH [Polyangiaceae bacterium]
MKLTVVAVGALRDRPMREAADDYVARLTRYARATELEIPDRDGDSALVEAVNKCRARGASIVALESDGEQMTSPGFARFVERLGSRGKGEIAFVLGGREGLPTSVRSIADNVVSFGLMTLPHRLARVVLFEQLYRAMTILRGEPYGETTSRR